jgi:peptidoglycan/xylan/chitin deacetylase (PgdA/CDA1 family)
MRLALKVDVDTYDGMRDGVPNFLRLFKELGIEASFYIPFGPDQSGRAVFRVFKKKGFLRKMFKSNALKLYGVKTMLRGTLLPAPMIGASFPELAREILKDGHELGIHGYNHVEWQDHLLGMSATAVRRHLERGIESYEKAVGRKPRAFAAPAWLASPDSLRELDRLKFDYVSDTRGRTPFFPTMAGEDFRTLQIPSTLPTLDELLGNDGLTAETVHSRLTREMEKNGLDLQVHSIHTEVEGTALFGPFSDWVRTLKAKGVEFVRLDRVAAEQLKNAGSIPRNAVVLDELPGRAGAVACQKSLP